MKIQLFLIFFSEIDLSEIMANRSMGRHPWRYLIWFVLLIGLVNLNGGRLLLQLWLNGYDWEGDMFRPAK
ncbi:MAG: hypothetical protein IGS03_01540 [Candidatus Sericytochromatia bacterium]|nr:hypothetical protein [Candidatus Sericytochromatia bacterium]